MTMIYLLKVLQVELASAGRIFCCSCSGSFKGLQIPGGSIESKMGDVGWSHSNVWAFGVGCRLELALHGVSPCLVVQLELSYIVHGVFR